MRVQREGHYLAPWQGILYQENAGCSAVTEQPAALSQLRLRLCWPGAEGHGDLLVSAIADDGQGEFVARRVLRNRRGQLRHPLDCLTIDRGDRIAGLQAS